MRAVLPIEHDGVRGLVAVGIIVEPSTDAAPEKTRRIGHGYAASDLGRARHGRRRGRAPGRCDSVEGCSVWVRRFRQLIEDAPPEGAGGVVVG